MLVMPAAVALGGHAAPEAGSRVTIIRTWTPSFIIESQIVPNLAGSPPAVWMSDSMPGSSDALVRLGRAVFSQRGDVVASGRITPTLPVDPPSLLSPVAVLLLSLPPQAERTNVHAAARAITDAHFDVAIDTPV